MTINGFFCAAAAVFLATAAIAQQVTFNLEDNLTLKDTEIAFGLDVTLTAQSTTRIGVDAKLDLRDLQKQVPSLLSGTDLLDVCGNETSVESLRLEAKDDSLVVIGRLKSNFFVCENVGDGNFKRGEPRFDINPDVRSEMSISIDNNCIVLSLKDLVLEPTRELDTLEGAEKNLEAARVLLVDAIALILKELPICPTLPDELSSLDPIYEDGGPRELGDGGFGIFMKGSVDASPSTILDVLTILQQEGVIPGRP